MAETANRDVAKAQVAGTTTPSTAEMKAAIRETRVRLATRLASTADHLHGLFTSPPSRQAEARREDLIGSAIRMLAVVGRTKRAWSDAKRTGLPRAAFGAAAVAIAATLATATRRR
jgi:hypothetical protein